MKLFFDDPEFDGQLQRTAGKVGTDQAMLGEVLATAQQIPAGDHDAWYRAWWTTAERVRGIGDVALREGHRVSAREAYLRAAEYYRQSFFFRRSDLDDEVARAAYRAERDTFLAAAGLFEHAFERVEIPFEGTTLVGHLHRPDGTGRPRPTLVSPGGYDGTLSEFWNFFGAPAIRRGYNALLFDGPGQGSSLWEKRLYLRPDYETVLTPVVDWLLRRPEVADDQLVAGGFSLGGYLVPRAATAEHRFAAMMVNPGQLDLGAALVDRMPAALVADLDDDTKASEFDQLLEAPGFRAMYAPRAAVHGVTSPQRWLQVLRTFTLRDTARNISCPTIVFDAADDRTASQTGRDLYDALTCEKEFVPLSDDEGAGGHGTCLGLPLFQQRAFDFCDRMLSTRAGAAV